MPVGNKVFVSSLSNGEKVCQCWISNMVSVFDCPYLTELLCFKKVYRRILIKWVNDATEESFYAFNWSYVEVLWQISFNKGLCNLVLRVIYCVTTLPYVKRLASEKFLKKTFLNLSCVNMFARDLLSLH